MKGITVIQQRVYLITVAVWVLLGLAQFFYMAHEAFTGPRGDAWFFYTWHGQAVVYLFAILPIWISVLGFVLFLEAGYFLGRSPSSIAPKG